jgi:hypothetical protein
MKFDPCHLIFFDSSCSLKKKLSFHHETVRRITENEKKTMFFNKKISKTINSLNIQVSSMEYLSSRGNFNIYGTDMGGNI